jgi:hypothetical protein
VGDCTRVGSKRSVQSTVDQIAGAQVDPNSTTVCQPTTTSG